VLNPSPDVPTIDVPTIDVPTIDVPTIDVLPTMLSFSPSLLTTGESAVAEDPSRSSSLLWGLLAVLLAWGSLPGWGPLAGPATVHTAAAQQTVCPGQEGAAAISCIQANYSPSGTLGYDTARDTMFANIDAGSSGELEGVYSGFTITLTPGEDPTQDAFSKGINTEHVFPQSKGAGTEPQRSDMHNLRPAREEVNSGRGNVPFGESPDAQTDAWYFEDSTRSAVPGSGIDAWSERLGQSAFEPREAKEGDIARAALYFYAVYRPSADDAFFDGMKDQLLQWHAADPVTQAELTRSEEIAQRQGNENPFVLDETLAGRAFSGGGDPPPGAPTAEALFISELSDAENDFTAEFFEIYNDSTGAVDLAAAGGKIVQDLRDGDQVFTFDFGTDETEACQSTVVPAKGTLVIGRGATLADFEAEWGSLPGGANYCAFNQNSFFPGTNERSWELRVGGTPGEPDGTLLGSSPQFDNIEGSRAYQDLSQEAPWIQGEPLASATPGTLDDGQVLPVEIARFEATATETGARLTWQTASETNNAGFEVQHREAVGGASRGAEAPTWTQVGYVESKAPGGSATETQSYSFAVENLPVGTHQFRLKQVDLDGSPTLTDPVSVDIQMQEALRLTAPAPNPTSGTATFSFAVREQSETRIRLYNTLGQQVATVYEGAPQAGEEQRAQIDVGGLSSGTYFLRLSADGQTQIRRLTVVR
jgi:hypothetical protein